MPAIVDLVNNFVRLRSDDTVAKLYLEWYNGATGSWEVKQQWDASTGNLDVLGKILVDLVVNESTPNVRLTGTETGAADIRMIEDAGSWILQYWNGTAWVNQLSVNMTNGQVTLIGTIVQDVQLNKSTPALRLTGTETGAGDISIRENTDRIEAYDNVAASSLGYLNPWPAGKIISCPQVKEYAEVSTTSTTPVRLDASYGDLAAPPPGLKPRIRLHANAYNNGGDTVTIQAFMNVGNSTASVSTTSTTYVALDTIVDADIIDSALILQFFVSGSTGYISLSSATIEWETV